METAAELLQVSCFHHLVKVAGVAWLMSRQRQYHQLGASNIQQKLTGEVEVVSCSS